jgi:hypothetical protein
LEEAIKRLRRSGNREHRSGQGFRCRDSGSAVELGESELEASLVDFVEVGVEIVRFGQRFVARSGTNWRRMRLCERGFGGGESSGEGGFGGGEVKSWRSGRARERSWRRERR